MDEPRDGEPAIPREELATVHSPLSPPSSGDGSASMRAAPVAGDCVGKYVVASTLGRGGMGIVVAARSDSTGELVAIKLLHPKAAKDAIQVERFVREARATVAIKSEHVVRVVDAGADPATGSPFIVMEFLQGRDLGHALANFGSLPARTAVDYVIQICEAVGAAHALGIVHRDLKPSNFFLTHRPDGTPLVKVLDFGISKAAQSDGTPDPRLTETQAVFGSPTYMSPEQIRSSKNVDQRSDLWSLGVALFEMLTGKLPFVADNVAGLLASVIADPPFTVSRFRPDVPPGLEVIVLACLEKDAARRIGSASELATRLAPFASPAGAELARRVPAIAPRTASSPSSPSVPPPQASSPSMPPMGSTPAPASLPFPAAAPFGTTETDLSCSPAAFRASVRRGTGRAVAVVVAATVTVLAIGGVLLLSRDAHHAGADATSTTAAGASANGATAAAPTTAASAADTASAPGADPAAATPSASPSASAVAAGAPTGKSRRKPGGRTGPRGSANADPAARPAMPSAPGLGLDSRF